MAFSADAEAALLKWVNLFPLEAPVQSLADLSDGYILSKMLEDIDPNYAVPVRELEVKNTSPSKWLTKKKSLEAVYKSLFRYIREECQVLNSMPLESPVDFNAIAEYDDKQQTFKLLAIFLMAAIKGARIEHYVEDITTRLDASTQSDIAGIIKMMGEGWETASSNNDQATNEYRSTDHDLALEEEIATLRKDLDEQMKKNADVFSRLERLTINHEQLQDEIIKKDAQIEALEGASSGDQSTYIESLQHRIKEQDQLIEQQEHQATTDQQAKDTYLRELLVLRPHKNRLIETEDKLKELSQKNAELERKANQVEHFKTKLAHLVNVQSENNHLREQLEVLQANQVDFDKVHEDNIKNKNTLAEYQRKFESYEMQIVEHSNQKSFLENEVRTQKVLLERMAERQEHDEKFISDLQDQLSTGPMAPNSPAEAQSGGLSLEEELEQSDQPSANYALEISRLKSENNALKDIDRRNDTANLRTELAESDRVRKRIEENFRELTERHAIIQEQLSAVLSSSTSEKNEALAHTRKLYLEATQELSTLRNKLATTEHELNSRHREVVATKADLSAIEEDDLNALETLRNANGVIRTSLENDLAVLRKEHQNLTTDFEVQKSQLLEALLSKDKAMQDLTALKEQSGTSELGTIESAKARSTKEAELEEQITKKDTLLEEFQRKLKKAEEATPDAQKAAHETMIKNLTRENALIATAWYDLTSRLQSNHVVLQRRQDAPKSWLNKQRQMVQATGRR